MRFFFELAIVTCVFLLGTPNPAESQPGDSTLHWGDWLSVSPNASSIDTSLLMKEYAPRSTVKARKTHVTQPRFPIIDIHTHFDPMGDREFLEKTIHFMDKYKIKMMGLVTGWYGDRLRKTVEFFEQHYPDRFFVMTQINWNLINDPDFEAKQAALLREAYQNGARGLKVWKDLGLQIQDEEGNLLPIDAPRLDTVWATCRELGMPVAIHTADPVAFFQPADRHNERLQTLIRRPEWYFHGRRYSFWELMHQRERVIARHPETTFIGLHLGWTGHDLEYTSGMLEAYPNYYLGSGAWWEVGRQPHGMQEFFIHYQDRILFETDFAAHIFMRKLPDGREKKIQHVLSRGEQIYLRWFQLLETDDDYIRSYRFRGDVHGINLPDSVLEKVYRKNAEQIFGLE